MTVHNELLRRESDTAPAATSATRGRHDELAGVLAAVAVAAAVMALLTPAGMGYSWLRPAAVIVAVLAAIATAVLVAVPADRPATLAILVRRLTDVWRHPRHDWHLGLLGVIASLPLWALHSRVLWDADSARIIATTAYVRQVGLGHLVRTQENWLPHLVMGPAAALGGIAATKAVSILSVQALFGVASYLTWKFTRSAAGALGTIGALYCCQPIINRPLVLPMYPTMLVFGMLGVYLAYRCITAVHRHWLWAFGAGACLMVSMEAHTLGQLFVLITGCLVVAAPWRRAIPGLLRVYAALTVVYLPRALLNIADGGLSRFLGNRVDYWITEGYLVDIQQRFWHLPVSFSVPEWLVRVFTRSPHILGAGGVVVLLLAVLGFFALRGRARLFAGAAFSLLALIFIYKRVPLYPRYFVQLFVGGALVAGVGIALLLQRGRQLTTRIAVAGVVVLLVVGLLTVRFYVRTAYALQGHLLAGPLPTLAKAIDDDRAVVGVRAGHLTFVDPDRLTYGGQFFSEREYVTFLTWPSDDRVVDLLRRHDIGWVLVSADLRMERRYHQTWIKPVYGERVRHLDKLVTSDQFCLHEEEDGYRLYRLGACVSARGAGAAAAW